MAQIEIETAKGSVSGELTGPQGGLIVATAHGAGGDRRGPLLAGFAAGLADEGIACLRFNFPYSEQGRRGPDPERTLRDAWTAAFEVAAEIGTPVWAAGKSLGGRIASMQVADGMPAAGLIFLGYPLHPPGKPDRIRDAHLPGIEVPMLFLQGTADPFARWELLEPAVEKLENAALHPVEGGDHSFRVRGQPRDDEATGRRLAAIAAAFVRAGS